MVKWGVLGFGSIARSFVNCFSELSNAQLYAIASKNKEKLSNLKKDFLNIKLYNNYDDLINDPDIDAIYISTVNHLHFDLVTKCILKKKKILCEKPIGLNFGQVESLFKLVKNSNTKCAEAIAYYTHPQIQTIRNIINSGTIGDVLEIQSYFGFRSRFNPQSRLYNENLGGGALLDLGCYPISFLMLFSNETYDIKFLKKKITYERNNIDDYAEAELVVNDKIKAKIFVSIKKNMKNICKIIGTRGYLEISNPWLPGKNEVIFFKKKFSFFKKVFLTKNDISIYANQIKILSDFFSNINSACNIFDIDKSLICSKLIDEWRNCKI